MKKGRMEAFSDGVLAILITIMVLELRPPEGIHLGALRPLLPVLLSYTVSFVMLGIYWNNHHHLLQAIEQVSGRVLWANLHLLFWLSLIPFGTAWVGQTRFAAVPVAVYGVVLFCAGTAYYILSRSLVGLHGSASFLANALGRDAKGKISVVLYAVAVPLAFLRSWIAYGIYVVVAVIWLVPDRRIEARMDSGKSEKRTEAEGRS